MEKTTMKKRKNQLILIIKMFLSFLAPSLLQQLGLVLRLYRVIITRFFTNQNAYFLRTVFQMYIAFMCHLLWYFSSLYTTTTTTFLSSSDWHFSFYDFDSSQSGHVHLISYGFFFFILTMLLTALTEKKGCEQLYM